MRFPPFLLDQWIQQHAHAEFDLASSTGPSWTAGELLALAGEDSGLDRLRLGYSATEGAADLRAAIAEMYGDAAESIQVFAGGNEALFHLLSYAAQPGANILIPHPCFPAYMALPAALGLAVRRYHNPPDLDEIRQLADAHTKLLLVNSPHNPTGAVILPESMIALHDFAAERGIHFVSDEVYHPIYHGTARPSAACLPHATVLGDFSKAFALGGLRLGWLVERDPVRREAYANSRDYLTISNSVVSEFLATIAIRSRQQIWARTQHVAQTNLRILARFMADHADTFDWQPPRGGMTAWVRLRDGSNSLRFCQAAIGRGVLLAPGDAFGVPDHFRIGFGHSIEGYASALDRLGEVLAAYCRPSTA